MSRTSIRTFLLKAKETLQTGLQKKQHLSFVIGNESADLDSLTSSLCFAYLRSLSSPPKPPFMPIWIPLVNLPAADVSLRPEFIKTLAHGKIQPEELITLDDLGPFSSLEENLPASNSQFVLVDHNALQGELGRIYSTRVTGVIDHHVDDKAVPDDAEPRIITPAGSCTSLVVNYLHDILNIFLISDDLTVGDSSSSGTRSEIAKIALASILIDTANMKSTDKVTKHDEQAVKELTAMLTGFDQNKFYEEIHQAKQDIGNLSLRDTLRKDYKQWKEGNLELGIASCVKPLGFLIDKAGEEQQNQDAKDAFLETVQKYAKERNLDIISIMTTSSPDGKFRRELFVWSLTPEAREAAEKFEQSASEELQLQDFQGPDLNDTRSEGGRWRKAWTQSALQHSRKRVAPLMREAMGKL